MWMRLAFRGLFGELNVPLLVKTLPYKHHPIKTTISKKMDMKRILFLLKRYFLHIIIK